jgi:hypothetical protein
VDAERKGDERVYNEETVDEPLDEVMTIVQCDDSEGEDS